MTFRKYLAIATAILLLIAARASAAAPRTEHSTAAPYRSALCFSDLSARGWTETKHEAFIMSFNGMYYDVDVTWYQDANGNVRVIIFVTLSTPDGTPMIWNETWNNVPGGRSNDPYTQIRTRLDGNGNNIGIWNDAGDRAARLTPNNNN